MGPEGGEPETVSLPLFSASRRAHACGHVLVLYRCTLVPESIDTFERARVVFLSPHPHSAIHHVYCLKVPIASVASLLGQRHHVDKANVLNWQSDILPSTCVIMHVISLVIHLTFVLCMRGVRA